MNPQAAARRAMALTLGFDTLTAVFAMAIAVAWRWWDSGGAPANALFTGAIASLMFGGAALASFSVLGVHKQVWRHSGWPDAVRIIQAAALTALVFLPLLFLWNRLLGFPRTALVIALGLWTLMLFAGRMVALARSTNRPFQIFQQTVRADAPRVLLVADLDKAAHLLRDLNLARDGAPVRILGLIEASGAQPGRAIRGVPVLGGMDELGTVLDVLKVRYGATPWLAVAGQARHSRAMAGVLETAAQHGAKIMALGTDSEGLSLRPVSPEHLLARPKRILDSAPLAQVFEGKRVIVTGAGGTIGSELATQCAALGVSHLTLFDASEYNLYSIDMKLREKFPGLELVAKLGDVRDKTRIAQVLDEYKPSIMIHAAALKHVPLMEQNACEAILTNVGGAINAVEASLQAGLERFVFISTDKAVDPDNVMGATKRLAELAISYRAKGTGLAVSMVRFGNVLGSSGSVVPLFERQIAAGGPITLTSDEVSRYFMTVEEASSLVLQGVAHNGAPGESSLYVLDMGDPIRIRTLAEAMIRMKGLVPYQDIRIRTTGLRPGEKLHEELTYDFERLIETGIDGLRKITPQTRLHKPDGFDLDLERLLKHAAARDEANALYSLGRIVPAYNPPNAARATQYG